LKGRAITLGNFDGVHRGHQALIEKTIQIANKEKLSSLAITYHPNPALVLGKKPDFSYLQNLDDRKQAILELGIDQVEVLEFNKNLANMEAEDFLEEILIRRFLARHIVIGYNHCFGKNQRGNYELLEALSPKYNYRLHRVEPVYYKEDKISSSLIRSYLQQGNIASANDCLGRRFNLQGTVIEGTKVGKSLGFPTANLQIPENQVLPANGVYATLTEGMKSVTNIGGRPTFGDNSLSLETHIMDWSGNLYGKTVRVEFVAKLRNVSRFLSPSDLSDQIQKDINRAKQILSEMA